MNCYSIDKIHEKYDNYLGEYKLLGSRLIYFPFLEGELNISMKCKQNLNLVEEYICKCIDRQIHDKDQICFLLGIDKSFLEAGISDLLLGKYLIDENNLLRFTDSGKDFFEENIKYVRRKAKISIGFDGINGKIRNMSGHNLIDRNDINSENDLIILPKKFPELSTMPNNDIQDYCKAKLNEMSYFENNNLHEYIEIEEIELCEDFKIYFHELVSLFYKNDLNNFQILAHDQCFSNFIDSDATNYLSELENRGYFNEFLSELEKEDSRNLDKIEKKAEINIEYIMNYRIRELFLDYLVKAEEGIYIISPWMNNYVVNEGLKRKFENLLKKGVKIRIISGIFNEKDDLSNYRDKNTKKIAEDLSLRFKKYGDLFKIKHGNTHEKIFICDDKICINGSFNFLSYSGEAKSGKFFRNEGSTLTDNKVLINEIKNKRFNF